MTTYKNSHIDFYYLVGDVDEDDIASSTTDFECIVILRENEIVIEYEEDNDDGIDQIRTWKGEMFGEGHYKLSCTQIEGNASLHRFHDSMILEGYINDDGEKCMWRVKLAE